MSIRFYKSIEDEFTYPAMKDLENFRKELIFEFEGQVTFTRGKRRKLLKDLDF